MSVSLGYVNNIIQFFRVRGAEIKDLRNATRLEREKFRRDYNQRATNKYLYSTTNVTRGTIMMVMGDYKVAYLIKNRSAYGDFIAVGRWYPEKATKKCLKHFVFDRAIFEQRAYFPKMMFIYKIEGKNYILNQDVENEHVYITNSSLNI